METNAKSPSLPSSPGAYDQPIREYIGRKLEGSLEQVDYVPSTHLRIWYNSQSEAYDTHHHEAVEIIIVKENVYPVTINEKTYILHPGDIFMIPSMMPHYLAGGNGKRFILLLDLSPLAPFTDFKALRPIMMRPYLINRTVLPDIYDFIYKELSSIISIYFAADDMWELSIYSHILKILEHCGKIYFRRKEAFSASDSTHSKVNYEKFGSLMTYIDLHYAEPLTLEWAADYVGFSKYHFHRLFKDYAGLTFHDYLCSRRVQEAQALLGTGMSITDVAFRSGFSGSTSFGRAFRAATGMTPSDYRKKRETIDSHGMSTYIRPAENRKGS